MLLKTDNVFQKVDAKNKCYKYRMPKHTCQNSNAKEM